MRVLAVSSGIALSCTAVAAGAARSQEKINPQFIAKADGLCAAIDARFTRILGDSFPFKNFDPFKPDPKTLPLVGKHFGKALPLRRAIPGQLRSLGEPSSGRGSWDAIRSLALRQNAVAIRQVSAALASNSEAFVLTAKQLQQLRDAIVKQATAAGFPKDAACGQLFS